MKARTSETITVVYTRRLAIFGHVYEYSFNQNKKSL